MPSSPIRFASGHAPVAEAASRAIISGLVRNALRASTGARVAFILSTLLALVIAVGVFYLLAMLPGGIAAAYLTTDAKRLVADYSTGMRKKAALGCALIHNPSVLFLDEPLEGVDPVSADVIRGLLTRFTESGSTVLFSSHVMELVEQVCDHVSIIDKGHIVATGTIDEVRGGKTLQRAFIDLVGPRAGGEEGLSWLGSSSN